MRKSMTATSHVEDAYRRLKRLMLQQKILPGQKLLYRQLTALLQMSKTPIVNALNRLEQEGFVVSEPNCGFHLKPIDAGEVRDSSEVREALEVKAVQQVVKAGRIDGLRSLEKKLQVLETCPPAVSAQKKFVLNAEFHLQLAEMSGNRVLKYLLKRNFEHIILRNNLDAFTPESSATTNREHRDLLAGLQQKDLAVCAAIIRRHVQGTCDLITRFLVRREDAGFDAMDFFKEETEVHQGR
jgi:DNA-binding GntR family transcriptional regulator